MYSKTNFKSKRLLAWAPIAIFMLSTIYSNHLFAEYHHVDGCTSCHNFFKFGGPNLYLIYEMMQTPNSGDRSVVFTAKSGPNSYADGDAVYDGACEVCHTQTRHHRNDGSDNTAHFDGEDCTLCHPHRDEFAASFSKSHDIHLSGNARRRLDCVDCHEVSYQQQSILFTDGETFANTGVCDRCHSPGGNYDGVNDPIIGAKSNWRSGVYDANRDLLPGKEMWCTGCHDRAPSHMRGNDWCSDCHNASNINMFD